MSQTRSGFQRNLRFHSGRNQRGKHAFRDVFVQSDAVQNPGLSHPFNIVFDVRGDLYVTSQNTNLTLRYHGPKSTAGQPGRPMPLPLSLAQLKDQKFNPGTFCASAKEVRRGLKVVRKAIFAQGILYVADRDGDCVRKHDSETGAYLGKIAAPDLIDKPIHLAVNGDALYIGNRGNESVVKCDLRREQVTPFISPPGWRIGKPIRISVWKTVLLRGESGLAPNTQIPALRRDAGSEAVHRSTGRRARVHRTRRLAMTLVPRQ
jgi:hypothetical protein